MNLPDLSLLMLNFRLQAEASAVLPPFLGSTLRGAFGEALKRMFCLLPHGVCTHCRFREDCAYQYIFESKNLGSVPLAKLHSQLRKNNHFPHPFVLIPPPVIRKNESGFSAANPKPNFNDDYARNHFSKGDCLEFSLLLMGEAVSYWSEILTAVYLLAENGLGEMRVPFSLTEAFAHDDKGETVRIFSQKNFNITDSGAAAVKLAEVVSLRVRLLEDALLQQGANLLQIRFVTPASKRILLNENENLNLSFRNFLRKITERIEHLSSLYAAPAQWTDYRPLLETAENLQIIESSLQSYLFEQRSNRQERDIPRHVFTGEIVYGGSDFRKYLPFLAAGEILNIGTGAGCGLGRFNVDQNGF